MRLHLETRAYAEEGALESKDAKIRAGAHIMAVLSGLYSDVEWAIVREYGTNMLDAYIALKRENPDATIIPPEIHLPNTFEPYIEFKDYGIGMDYDTVWNIFTDYGESTKQENDEEVGGFGLGSKTAFCYAGGDVWTIESRHDGECHIIHATRSDQGIPRYHRLATLPTDEPNGVTIRIPVRMTDRARFVEATRRLVTHFPMEINVVGDGSFEAPAREYLLSGETWGVAKSLRYHSGGRDHTVVMGNVPYDLEVEDLIRAGVSRELAYGATIDLRVPVGAVVPVPSRERLMMNDITRKGLQEAVALMLQELPEKAAECVQECETEWDAITNLKALLNLGGLQATLNGVKWRGVELNVQQGIKLTVADLKKVFPDVEVTTYKNPYRTLRIQTDRLDEDGDTFLNPGSNVWLFIDDLKRGSGKRVKAFLQDKVSRANSWSNRRRVDGSGKVVVVKAEGLTACRLSPLLGGAPVEGLTSGLADPNPPLKKGATPTTDLTLLQDIWESGNWQEVTVDPTDTAPVYYVRLNRTTMTDFSGYYQVKNVKDALIGLGFLTSPYKVLGIPRGQAALEGTKGWVSLWDFAVEIAEAKADKLKEDMARVRRWDKYIAQIEKLSPFKEVASEDDNLKELFEEEKEVRELRDKVKHASRLIHQVKPGLLTEEDVSDDFIPSRVNNFYTKYPLLRFVERYVSPQEVAPFVREYIDMKS
jgi:hypothetical protein